MNTFELEIVSMDGSHYRGAVQMVTCRSVAGDVAILARHCNYCTAVGMGTSKVVMADGTERYAACMGGMLSVVKGKCRMIVTIWEWSDDIDVERAERAKERAEQKLQEPGLDEHERQSQEARVRRAEVRIAAARRIKTLGKTM